MIPARLIVTAAAAGWLVPAVAALRLCRKIPRGMICLLWGLVALRLVCPFSVKSPLSLIPDPEAVTARIVSAAPEETEPEPEDLPASLLPAAEPETPGPDIGQYGTAIWLTGTAALLLYALAGWLRLRRTVAASLPVKGNIRICDGIASPFILGVLRPRIYLPSAMDREQFSYVLAHENAHLARHDHWWKPLGFVLLSVYWFHPLLWAAYILFCRDVELACDERVVRDMDLWEKKVYSQILLSCAAPGPAASVCPVSFGGVGVKARVQAVLRYRKPALRALLWTGAAGVLLAVCFLTDPPDRAGAAAAPSPAPTQAVHRLEYTPPSPSPAAAAPEPSSRPTKGQVLAARKKALAGMTQAQIDRLTQVITDQNQWWEQEYLSNILTRLDDPDDLAWNYFDQTGDIDVGEGVLYADETGLTGDERLALCEKEGITVDEFFEKYGTEKQIRIGGYSKYSVDEIAAMLGELRESVQDRDLRTDLAYLANQILWARETHRMLYVSNLFKTLHDMDYYLLRYGPSDQPSTDTGYGVASVVSNYYGMLTAFGADHGEGIDPRWSPAPSPPPD